MAALRSALTPGGRTARCTAVALAVIGWGTAQTPEAPRSPRPAPTHADIRYGPHERNVLDFYAPPGGRTVTPLVVYIHGGSWVNGDKARPPIRFLQAMLAGGAAVASINYRVTTTAPLPAPVHDAARAIQFLRTRAGEWRFDRTRIAAAGYSAGGCTALWLAYHDDLADQTSADPVARESSRVRAALGTMAQTSIDPPEIKAWVGEIVLDATMLYRAVGAKDRADFTARYAELAPLFREFSPINHVGPGDPPVMVAYDRREPLPATKIGVALHHATFGDELRARAEAAGLTVILRIEETARPDELSPEEFLLRHLGL